MMQTSSRGPYETPKLSSFQKHLYANFRSRPSEAQSSATTCRAVVARSTGENRARRTLRWLHGQGCSAVQQWPTASFSNGSSFFGFARTVGNKIVLKLKGPAKHQSGSSLPETNLVASARLLLVWLLVDLLCVVVILCHRSRARRRPFRSVSLPPTCSRHTSPERRRRAPPTA